MHLVASGYAPLRMETDLLSSTLVNVTSSSPISPRTQLFGSEVSQRLVGSCVRQSTNHDSGTGMMSPNLGGNVMCLNTSFSSCIRQRNTDLKFSFESRTNTSTPARLNNVTSDVTSVSFTLCTFNEMTVAAGSGYGGAAIFLINTLSSLSVTTCFFHKCSCTESDDDGGAVFFQCSTNSKRPVSISASSFTDCSTLFDENSGNCGGSIFTRYTRSTTVDSCFFEFSESDRDGAAYVASDIITISKCDFVECTSTSRAGGVSIMQVTTLSLSFLRFRGGSSVNTQTAKDIYFNDKTSTQITSSMIKSCDSTSGAPNVYFKSDNKANDKLIPQISTSSNITTKSVHVSFDENDATVSVTTAESIKGTMDVLLDGSNVPRLVHVVFGDASTSSNLGTAVVSSGSNGVLPRADYVFRSAAVTGSRIINSIEPFIFETSSTLKDCNTTEIVVNGASLKEGSFWMLVEKDEIEVNITLTWSNSTTLIGTSPLHPSTAKGRLEWETEYKMTKVMWDGNGVEPEQDIARADSVTFTTPTEPTRITSADCSLGGDQQKSAIVSLTGVKLGGGKGFAVGVRKMEGSTLIGDEIELSGTLSGLSSSTTHSHSVVIFGAANPLLSFGTKYVITRFEVSESVCVVDSDVTFSVPSEPSRLTSLDASLQYSTDEKSADINLSGIGMEGLYNLTLSVNSSASTNVTLTASFDSDGRGTLAAVLFDSSDPPIVDLSFNTRYEVVGVTKETKPVLFESGLVFTTMPVPPRLLSISVGDFTVGLDFVELCFGSIALPSEATFTLTLESVHSDGTTPHQKAIVLETDPSGQLILHCAQLYPFEKEAAKKKGQLEYNTEYKVLSFTKDSSLIHFEDSTTRIQTPIEPARIVRMEKRELNNDRTKMIVWLEGHALLSRTGKVSLSKGSTSWESLWEVFVKTDTHCTAEFAVGKEETSDELKYGEEYTLKGSWTELSGFHVEDGITIVVPLPPMITQMEFVFSNTLHTGCFVNLSGTDLIVGDSLKVTLNDSLSFIATINSDSKAQSTELLIGWPTTLQHNTKYTIKSIEATDPDDGKTLFDSAISNTTGSLPDDVVIFVDCGSTSDSSLLCGDRKRPCRWIEDGWKIVEGIGISSLSMSIIHNTTQNSQVRMESDHEVVISSGPSTKPELFLSASSSLSEMEGEGMVEVVGGRLWIHQVDVVLSDSPSLIFIRMIGGHLTIETCSLTSTSSTLSNSDTTLCLWSAGAIVLKQGTTTITSSTFSELSFGAINMKGGSLSVETSAFHDNNPSFSSFPSLRHNIRCSEGGEIEIGSLSGGDGKADHPHLWLSNEDCVLSGEDVNANAPFFIPTLSSSSTSTLNKTSQAFDLTMKGTTLIPCSLFLEVFEKKKDGSEGKMVRIGLSVDSTKSFNETEIEMRVPVSWMSGFEKGLEWRGRVMFGQNETTTSFVIQKNLLDRAAQSVKENMKWWIPLLVSLVFILLLIVIVVLICLRRRKNNQKTGQGIKIQEMNDEDEARLEMEQKMEESTPEKSVDHLIYLKETTPTHSSHPTSTSVPIDNQFVEVLGESGEVGVVDWTKAETLFDVLHRPEKKREIEKKAVSRSITKGLIGVLGEHPTSPITTRFSPHWVIVNNNVVQLRLGTIPEEPREREQGTQNLTQREMTIVGEQNDSFFGGRLSAVKGGTVEGQRWRAPEVCRSVGEKIDVESALVFSLGLVLWEVWTGEVPWKEMDEANACRQNEGGVQPNLKLVLDTSIRSLISQCLSFDPKERPSLQDVFDGLEVTEEKVAEQPSHVSKANDAIDIRS